MALYPEYDSTKIDRCSSRRLSGALILPVLTSYLFVLL